MLAQQKVAAAAAPITQTLLGGVTPSWSTCSIAAVGGSMVAGTRLTASTAVASTSVAAANFQKGTSSSGLRLWGTATAGQLAVSVTMAGGAAGHIDALVVTLAAVPPAGRRTCASLPVQVRCPAHERPPHSHALSLRRLRARASRRLPPVESASCGAARHGNTT